MYSSYQNIIHLFAMYLTSYNNIIIYKNKDEF